MPESYVRAIRRNSVFAVVGFSVILFVLGCLQAGHDAAREAAAQAEECPMLQQVAGPFTPTPDPISTP